MKRVFIVHGWGGKPDVGWMKWLNKELTSKGYKVIAERMPQPEFPKIGPWVENLKRIVGKADGETYFIGHSIGCQTIIRYLETLPEDSKIGGAIFVGGWLKIKEPKTKEEIEVSAPWLTTKINFDKVKKIINKSVLILSDDDIYVPLDNSDLFKKKLGSKIVLEKSKGHYIENVTKEIPAVMKEFLDISR
jgi:uncharacterized protein